MTTFAQDLATNKTFVGNVIVGLLGQFFSIRTPDSGLWVLPEAQGLVTAVMLNPTTIDPRRVSTTIANYSVKLLDKNNLISNLVQASGLDMVNQPISIWLGRTGVGMDFSEYTQLPTTKILSISHVDNSYSFTTVDDTNRIDKPIFAATTRLSDDIFDITTSFQCLDDISLFPDSGSLKIDNEFMSYNSKDDSTNTFIGLVRGIFGTTPVSHTATTTVDIGQLVTDNPINILIRALVSGGGGGAFDNLLDGCAIDQSLIDITDMEATRDELFPDVTFSLGFYPSEISDSCLTFLEDNILMPCNLRFTYSANSKLTVGTLDRARFVDDEDVIDEDTIVNYPQWNSDGSKIVNNIQVSWDFDEDLDQFNQIVPYINQASVDAYGLSNQLTFEFRGIVADFDGQDLINAFVTAFFNRLAVPCPEIDITVQLNQGLVNVCDKTILQSSQVPSFDGTLNFDSELEVISRSVNWQTGDVKLKVAFTSFTGVRSCYLAPADSFVSVIDQSNINLGSGRGVFWDVGWNVRLWNNLTGDYETDPVNSISLITVDQITFTNPWTTTLTTNHRLKFCDYDQATATQKRYCFISPTGLDFSSTEKSYKIVP